MCKFFQSRYYFIENVTSCKQEKLINLWGKNDFKFFIDFLMKALEVIANLGRIWFFFCFVFLINFQCFGGERDGTSY